MAIAGTLKVDPEVLRAQSNTVENERRKMQGYFDDLKSVIEGSSGYWI